MADERQNEQETRLSIEDMPDEVRQFADTMLGINPQWNLNDWLVEQANLAMDLLAVDLLREKMMIDQRLQRLDDLGRRLEIDGEQSASDDPYQRNLFDCFDLNEAHPMRGLGSEHSKAQRLNTPAKKLNNIRPTSSLTCCLTTTRTIPCLPSPARRSSWALNMCLQAVRRSQRWKRSFNTPVPQTSKTTKRTRRSTTC